MALDYLIDREALAWAGGMFEGEGSFSLRTKAIDRGIPCASLNSTDADVLLRFAGVLPVGRCYGPYQRGGGNYKPQYVWQVGGFEETQALVALLWPWLASRRRARAKEVLEKAGPRRRARRKDQAWAVA